MLSILQKGGRALEVKGLSHVPTVVKTLNGTFENQRELQNQKLQNAVEESNESIEEQVKIRVEAVNEFLVPLKTSIKFVFHEELQEYYVEVINENTNEVIREIPPKKFLDMYAEMAKFMGLIIDKKG